MADYEVKFPKKDILTREDYDAHGDELFELVREIYEEYNRMEVIRKKLKLKKVR